MSPRLDVLQLFLSPRKSDLREREGCEKKGERKREGRNREKNEGEREKWGKKGRKKRKMEKRGRKKRKKDGENRKRERNEDSLEIAQHWLLHTQKNVPQIYLNNNEFLRNVVSFQKLLPETQRDFSFRLLSSILELFQL